MRALVNYRGIMGGLFALCTGMREMYETTHDRKEGILSENQDRSVTNIAFPLVDNHKREIAADVSDSLVRKYPEYYRYWMPTGE